MYKVFEFETAEEALNGIMHAAARDELGFYNNNSMKGSCSNLIIQVKDTRPMINLKMVGYADHRWNKFLKDYLNIPDLIGMMGLLNGSKSNVRALAYQFPNGAQHSLGGCLTALHFESRYTDYVKLTSRTANWIPVGALDLSFLNLICQSVGEHAGMTLPPSGLWTINQFQLNYIQGSVWMQTYGQVDVIREYARQGFKAANHMVDRYDQLVSMDKKIISWKAFKRTGEKLLKMIEVEQQTGQPINEEYYPRLPAMINPTYQDFVSGNHISDYTLPLLVSIYSTNERTVKNHIKVMRTLLKKELHLPVRTGYTSTWPSDHPELILLEWCMTHQQSAKSIEALMDVFDQESREDLVKFLKEKY